MTRTQTLLVTTAMALALPLASAMAQTATTKCGPVAFSTERMGYSSAPCPGGETAGVVGTSGPTVFGANNSTTMTKAEMKQGVQAAPPGVVYAPMQAQAMPMHNHAMPMQTQAIQAGPNMASAADQCGPLNAVAVRDEYGRRYNCRGDRIR